MTEIITTIIIIEKAICLKLNIMHYHTLEGSVALIMRDVCYEHYVLIHNA